MIGSGSSGCPRSQIGPKLSTKTAVFVKGFPHFTHLEDMASILPYCSRNLSLAHSGNPACRHSHRSAKVGKFVSGPCVSLGG